MAAHRGRLRQGGRPAPPQRTAPLDQLCGGNDALRAEVVGLLSVHDGAPELLTAAAFVPPPTSVPTRIGPSRILDLLGEGGMGSVYRVVRDQGDFAQHCALKLLRPDLAGPDFEAHFRAERRILASLTHPAIARLIDGGTDDTGIHYLVLELVEDAEPIDDHCRRQALSVRQRIALVIELCAAVASAHAGLVVHPDIKPANVLVGRDGKPKVRDFAVAKVLTATDGGLGTVQTRAGPAPLTLACAAPEQLVGGPLGTGCDIYGPGVLLYGLLTDAPPYDRSGLGLAEVTERICQSTPPPPSVTAGSPATAAALRGDLDAIVMKTLRKDPEDRYATANALAADLQRYLDGRPVLALAGSRRYRVRKFVQRHRAGLTAGALVVLALAAGSAGTAWQAHQVTVERDRALVQQHRAQRVAALIEAVFAQADPATTPGHDTLSAQELLARGEHQVVDTLDDEPTVQADLFDVLGRVQASLGAWDKAVDLHLRALNSRNSRAPGEGPIGADVFDSAEFDSAEFDSAEFDRAEFDRAEFDSAEFDSAEFDSAEFDSLLPDEASACTLLDLGEAARRAWRWQLAETALQAALDQHRRLFGVDDPRRLTAEAALAVAISDESGGPQRPGEARALFDDALARSGPDQQALRADCWFGLGTVDRLASHYADAAAHYQRAADTWAELGQTIRQAEALEGVSVALAESGDFGDRQQQTSQQALALKEGMLGPDHPLLVDSLLNVGANAWRRGANADAIAIYERALAITRASTDDDAPTAIIRPTSGSLGCTLATCSGLEGFLQEAYAIRVRDSGPRSGPTSGVGRNLARVLLYEGKLDAAERLARDAVTASAASAADGPQLWAARNRGLLGAVLLAQGRPGEAEVQLQRALDEFDQLGASDHIDITDTLLSLSALRLAQGRADRARELAEHAVKLRSRALVDGHWQTWQARSVLGAALRADGQPAAGQRLLDDAAAALGRQLPADHYALVAARQRRDGPEPE